ncbi:MAG: hypothetical protein ACLR4Z_11840 [Butyricicoccaceae bacterium]
MLKLLKYEWKACARTCLPLYGAIILVALINHLLYSEAVPDLLFGIPAAIMSMLYAVIFAAVFVATAVILVQRFYKSLLGGEGYLMFTLPVSVTQHIFSKAIIAVAMCFLSCLVAFLSILLLSHGINPAAFSFFDLAAVPYVLEGLLWLVLCAFAAVLFIYLCIALGHLAKKHRLLMAFVWYFCALDCGADHRHARADGRRQRRQRVHGAFDLSVLGVDGLWRRAFRGADPVFGEAPQRRSALPEPDIF